MKKSLLLMAWVCLVCIFSTKAQEQAKTLLEGLVYTSERKEPLPGALVKIQNSDIGVIANSEGNFRVSLEPGEYTLQISFIGYAPVERKLSMPYGQFLEIRLLAEDVDLEGVEVVSTGYQTLPRERSTGSFVQLDRKLLERRVSTGILERLEDVTPGLVFNRGPSAGNDPISIRGRSTLYANVAPLIILDNFPYDGPIENINPNDVESITILKDAAAASIWGARAGNGVIVVTTKRGTKGKGFQLSLNSNLTVTEAPDPFYIPQMDMENFIDYERHLFDQGYYNSAILSNRHPTLSPAVETLLAHREGLLSDSELEERLQQHTGQDVRREFSKYYYRPSANRQYALGISGRGEHYQYRLSAGYDNNLEGIHGNHNDRFTFGSQNRWTLDRLAFGAGFYFSRRAGTTGTAINDFYPYQRLADDNGNAIPVSYKQIGYSDRYLQSIDGLGLLDWRYRPLEEIGLMDNTSKNSDIRLHTDVQYRISRWLRGEILYQYWQNLGQNRNHRPGESYFSRNLVNNFSRPDADGNWTRPIPEGGIMDISHTGVHSHNLRVQAHVDHHWDGQHTLNGLGGWEIRSMQLESNTTRYYGYDDALGLSRPVDYTGTFPYFAIPGTSNIPNMDSHSGQTDRFLSYYGNMAYTFRERYSLSVSARKDASNLFGVEANQRGVPLWSAGLGWVISAEEGYRSGLFSYLKLKTTYGYNGNIDKSLSAFTTVNYLVSRATALNPNYPYAFIVNPPNPELRWERIRILNLGLDFELGENRLAGSVEYYVKNGRDLIGDTNFPQSSGITVFRGNFADTESKGWDISLQSRNIKKAVSWDTDFFFSHIREKVTSFQNLAGANEYLNLSGLVHPMEGRPLFGVYSYPFAGLDPDTGDPMGLVDGEPSKDYNAIITDSPPLELYFHGPSRPATFGALRNSFSWNGISLSFNISYRLGYYYRRASVNYGLLQTGEITHADFERRWQRPGDELVTTIPSLPERQDGLRDYFHRLSSGLVERGDHIRLQDIRLAYNLDRQKVPGLFFRHAEIYSYINNLGILWKAADDPLDPDFQTGKPLRSIAVGLKLDF